MKRLLFVVMIAAACTPPLWAQSAAEKELLAIERTWLDAAIARDAAVLEKLYADEFLFIDRTGVAHTKAEDMATLTAPGFRLVKYALSDLRAHVYGEAGVVTGITKSTIVKDGKKTVSRIHFLDVFVRRDGRWQAVHTQSTPMAQ